MENGSYVWRRLSESERALVLAERQNTHRPWHSPPHRAAPGIASFHVTAACYEHAPRIGQSPTRMDDFSTALLSVCQSLDALVHAWTVLPNHYHLLVQTRHVLGFLHALGKLHGATAYQWNLEEEQAGRKNFHRAAERRIRSERHYWATLNYVHNNPVRHGYVKRWQEWRWSSAADYLTSVGPAEAARIWRDYPVGDYGAQWDDPEL